MDLRVESLNPGRVSTPVERRVVELALVKVAERFPQGLEREFDLGAIEVELPVALEQVGQPPYQGAEQMADLVARQIVLKLMPQLFSRQRLHPMEAGVGSGKSKEELAIEAELAKANEEVAWMMAETAADVAGVFDPTPTSDLVSAGLAMRRGDVLGAGLGIVSGFIPYIGDAVAKTYKGTRLAARLAELKKKIGGLVERLSRLRQARNAPPPGKLPPGGEPPHPTKPTTAAAKVVDPRIKQQELAYRQGKPIKPTDYGGGYYGNSSIDPQQVLREGLPGRGGNLDLVDHAENAERLGKEATAFRGTTQNIGDPHGMGQGAAEWAGAGGHVVDVKNIPTWELSTVLENQVKKADGSFGSTTMKGELERSIPARVYPWQVERVGKVSESSTGKLYVKEGDWIRNPNFNKPEAYPELWAQVQAAAAKVD